MNWFKRNGPSNEERLNKLIEAFNAETNATFAAIFAQMANLRAENRHLQQELEVTKLYLDVVSTYLESLPDQAQE